MSRIYTFRKQVVGKTKYYFAYKLSIWDTEDRRVGNVGTSEVTVITYAIRAALPAWHFQNENPETHLFEISADLMISHSFYNT